MTGKSGPLPTSRGSGVDTGRGPRRRALLAAGGTESTTNRPRIADAPSTIRHVAGQNLGASNFCPRAHEPGVAAAEVWA